MRNGKNLPVDERMYEVSRGRDGEVTVLFSGNMDSSVAGKVIRDLTAVLKKDPPQSIAVDLSQVSYLDEFGVLILVELKKIVSAENGTFALQNVSTTFQQTLSLLKFDSLGRKRPFSKAPRQGAFLRIGDAALRYISDLKDAISFVGSVFLAMGQAFLNPRRIRIDDTLLYMQRVGVDGLPIVALISFLLGLIMAFMSSVQLQQFGANIYVASLVSLAMTRELGPIMTAIIVAGRSGSSFAAEIGTMKISEEVDALFTMGFDPVRFLVVPKMLAAVIMVPILILFSDIFAIVGGMLVGVFMLDLTAGAYIDQTIKTLELFDVFWGVLKGGVFAALVAAIGCLRGFQVRGGAASVGEATTSAVVTSLFFIIFTDSMFSVILRYWD